MVRIALALWLAACASHTPLIASFPAAPLTVNDGDSVDLAFSTSEGRVTLNGQPVSGASAKAQMHADPFVAAIARSFTLTVQHNESSVTQTLVVTVLRAPTAPIIAAPSTLTAPQNAIAVVSAEPGMHYSWQVSGAIAQSGEQSAALSFRVPAPAQVTLICIAENALGLSAASPSVVIDAHGVTTVAGSPGVAGNADGPGAAARFSSLTALQRATDGTLYGLDLRAHSLKRLRPIGSDWEVTTLAGASSAGACADGSGPQARFDHPSDLWLDAANQRLLVSEGGSVGRVRAVSLSGSVTTLIAGGSGPDSGCPATTHIATLGKLAALTMSQAGDIWGYDDAGQIFDLTTATVQATLSPVSDTASLRFDGGTLLMLDGAASCVRRAPSFVCWAGGAPGSVDGAGTSAGFTQPLGMSVSAQGWLIGDTAPASGGLVRLLSAQGVVATVAGTASANRTTGMPLLFGVMPSVVSGLAAGAGVSIFVAGDDAVLKLDP